MAPIVHADAANIVADAHAFPCAVHVQVVHVHTKGVLVLDDSELSCTVGYLR
jgi:hypothetical protein